MTMTAIMATMTTTMTTTRRRQSRKRKRSISRGNVRSEDSCMWETISFLRSWRKWMELRRKLTGFRRKWWGALYITYESADLSVMHHMPSTLDERAKSVLSTSPRTEDFLYRILPLAPDDGGDTESEEEDEEPEQGPSHKERADPSTTGASAQQRLAPKARSAAILQVPGYSGGGRWGTGAVL